MRIFDPHFVMEYNWYRDEYGLDTISMGVTAAFLMECGQRGYISAKDIGYDLSWGNTEGVSRLLRETATMYRIREGMRTGGPPSQDLDSKSIHRQNGLILRPGHGGTE